MSETTRHIAQRLSLRKPQKESLELFEKIVQTVGLNANEEKRAKLEKVAALQLEKFSDFERDFPSFAFALATGVGKTRLMGAFISYLYLAHGLRDYLVLAPNLTIYNKLIEDFSNPSNPKYVFRGISEFVHSPPKIITGDNYANVNTVRTSSSAKKGQYGLFSEEVFINIFNISKMNAETRSGNIPRIKRLSEYLGESYFEYLRNLGQLVLFMDEAHQYRAERGMAVINELKPALGIELTATPKTKQGSKTAPFQNIVYEYSLARAIRDGFVKEPAVATRRNLDQKKLKAMGSEALDRLKLEDAIRVHENTKTHLLKYAKDNNRPLVKPFILVVAQNTEHAGEIEQFIKSQDFFDGRYANNVITVHSNQKGEEKDENIELLLSLERPENPVEIVIHVNMLKEGWDVTNLYTLVPLRAFAADILTEQTLGRGLRLPYGEKTGDLEVDKLTVIAHDRFDELIKAAQDENSIILKETIIDIDDPDFSGKQEVVQVPSSTLSDIEKEEKAAEQIKDDEARNQALLEAKVKRLVMDKLSSGDVDSLNINPHKLDAKDANKQIQELVKGSLPLFDGISANDDLIKKVAESVTKDFLPQLIKGSIAIPRITIQPKEGSIRAGFRDFKLNTSGLRKFNPIHDEIQIKTLQDQRDTIIGVINEQGAKDTHENMIVAKLLDYDEVDYETHGDLLYRLASEMVAHLKTYLKSEEDLFNVILTQRTQMAEHIWQQMREHFYCEVDEYEVPIIKPFTTIEPHNYSHMRDAEPKDYKATVKTIAELKRTLFTGFKKACHSAYKFDSFGEHRFAQILEAEAEKEVQKWLRPAPRQFHLYWDHGTKLYEPDFVVENGETVWIVEVKAKSEIDSKEVQEKKRVALEFCKHATEFCKNYDAKKWGYLLIPDEEITLNKSFSFLKRSFEVTP